MGVYILTQNKQALWNFDDISRLHITASGRAIQAVGKNGQLQRKNEVLQQQIEDRDHIAEKNHNMYMKQIKNKEALLLAKDKQIEWLESFAAAFLIVAYGEDVREIKMSQDKILKLMTEYKLEMKHDPETGDWIFNVSVSEKEKKS